jgi:hypothetical protein
MSASTRPKPSDYDEAGRDIENNLASIKSIAGTIDGLDDAVLKPGVLSYLADRLVEHYDEIYDAFSRIFGYGEYAEKKPGEASRATLGGDAKPTDNRAKHELEDALTDIKGIATILVVVGEGYGESGGSLSYLGGQLHDHFRKAHEAFCRIYRLDQGDNSDKGGAA